MNAFKLSYEKYTSVAEYFNQKYSFGEREPLDQFCPHMHMQGHGERPHVVCHPEQSASSAGSLNHATFILQKSRRERLNNLIADELDQLTVEVEQTGSITLRHVSD
ncbi:unnamed protein product [Echinostoma caproni]|uniref:BHLH domain-containing protein n=1 Tax=Echinostoma caproni TaxID=27848 RepID=A0A183BE11_9TREM|nr:unnamed protein product [Echinostoma caproni]